MFCCLLSIHLAFIPLQELNNILTNNTSMSILQKVTPTFNDSTPNIPI